MNMYTRWCLWDLDLQHRKEEIRRPSMHGEEQPAIHKNEIDHRATCLPSREVRKVR